MRKVGMECLTRTVTRGGQLWEFVVTHEWGEAEWVARRWTGYVWETVHRICF